MAFVKTHVALSLLAPFLAIACGARTFLGPLGSEESSTAVVPVFDASAAIVSACVAEETAACALRSSCTGGASITYHYGTMDVCVSRETDTCIRNLLAPETARTPALAEECAHAIPTESCTDYWDGNTLPVCQAYPGPRELGAPCGVDSQCATTFCAISAGSMCGVCQEPPLAGTPCRSGLDCWYNLSCPLVADTAGICTAYVVPGGACDGSHFCEGGYSCIGADAAAGVAGTCQASTSVVGAACNYATGPGCDNRLYLYCMDGTCQPEPIVGAGQPCDLGGSDYLPLCEGGGVCITNGPGTRGTCVGPAADGAACDLALGPPCLPSSRCITAGGGTAGVCAFVDPESCG